MRSILRFRATSTTAFLGNLSLGTRVAGITASSTTELNMRWRTLTQSGNAGSIARWSVYGAINLGIHAFLNARGPIGFRMDETVRRVITSGSGLRAAWGMVTRAGSDGRDDYRGLGFVCDEEGGEQWRAFLRDDDGDHIQVPLGIDATVPHVLLVEAFPPRRLIRWMVDGELVAEHTLARDVSLMSDITTLCFGVALYADAGVKSHALYTGTTQGGISVWYDPALAPWSAECSEGGPGSWAEN